MTNMMQGNFWIVNSDEKLENYIAELRDQYKQHKYLRCQVKTGKQRSDVQNNALHKYCEMLAESLNSAGLDMRKVLKPEVEIPWNKDSVKDELWRPIQIAMTKKKSTTEPLRGQYGEIYETLNRHMSQKFGISVPWPCKESKAA